MKVFDKAIETEASKCPASSALQRLSSPASTEAQMICARRRALSPGLVGCAPLTPSKSSMACWGSNIGERWRTFAERSIVCMQAQQVIAWQTGYHSTVLSDQAGQPSDNQWLAGAWDHWAAQLQGSFYWSCWNHQQPPCWRPDAAFKSYLAAWLGTNYHNLTQNYDFTQNCQKFGHI